jgi:hypothetical protein
MNFKPLFLFCIVSLHAVMRGENFYSIEQIVIKSDPMALFEALRDTKIPKKKLQSLMNLSEEIIKHRQEDINNFFAFLQASAIQPGLTPTSHFSLPEEYKAKCGSFEGGVVIGVVGVMGAVYGAIGAATFFGRERFMYEWKVLAGLGAMGLVAIGGFFHAYRCKKLGLKQYNVVCRDYLEDQYKEALQVKELIAEKLDQALDD